MFKLNPVLKALLGVLSAGALLVSQAQMAQEPLLTKTVAVEPNLVLMFDDSASMPASYIYQYGGSPGPLGMTGPTVANVDKAPDVNLIYYDPRVTFLPRINANGTRQAVGATGSISSFNVYWRTCEPTSTTPTSTCGAYTTTSVPLRSTAWVPASSLLATGATTSLGYPITANSTANTTGRYPKFKDRTDCTTSALHCTWAEERQNYANWNTYHKTRLEMVKTGLGEAFQPVTATLRLGWGTINVIESSSPNRLDAGVSLYNSTVKNNFYSWLYARTGPTTSTPNRLALKQVGQYFSRKDDDGPWGNTPLATGTGRNVAATGSANAGHASCRRSYSLLVTDGYWNDSSPGVGKVDDIAATLTSITGATYTYDPAVKNFYKDATANTLADVAMKYWITDLRTDVDNRVKTIPGVNESFWQNMSFYAVSLGLDGTLAQNATTLNDLANDAINWPAPISNNPTTIDDMWHATLNGRGQMLNAASSDSLTKAVASMLANIESQTSSQSGVAVSTASLNSGTSKYTPQYKTVSWTGNLIARTLDANTGSEVSPTWMVESGVNTTTGDPITTIPAATVTAPAVARYIVVGNGSTTAPKAVSFTNTLPAALLASMGGTANADLVDYLRGDTSKEQRKPGGIYRNREARLGDVVNSSPVFVKNNIDLSYEKLPTAEASTYQAYITNTKVARSEGVVYVGANDGMLHAFRESNGAEIFAYIPRAVLPNLYKLADPAYGTAVLPHQFYVDGPNIETDAYWGGAWKNVLVGTTGGGVGAAGSPHFGGAKAVFALDVTTPLTTGGAPNLSAANVLWEVSPSTTGFAEMGNVLSDVQAGQTTGGTWVGIFANGYFSTSGTARLFVVNLQTGALIREINTGSGTSTTKNGLGGIRVVRNASQQILGVYGGDLYGNLWKFDLTDTNPANWSVGMNGGPVYSAGSTQPITAMSAVLPHPSGNGYVVSFGTGKFFENADTTSTDAQRMYGIWDSVGFGSPTTGTTLSGISALQPQTISTVNVNRTITDNSTIPPTTTTVTIPYYRITTNALNWATQKGWYIDLPNSGQRVVYPVEIVASPFIGVDSISPANSVITDPCTVAGQGAGWLYFINGLTGAGPSEAIFDTNGDNVVDSSDAIVSGINTTADGRNTSLKVTSKSDSLKTTIATISGGSSGSTVSVFTCQLLGTCTSGTGGASPRIKTREWRQLFMR